MAMVGMAGTAIGVGIAVLKEKADRRSIIREAEEELAEQQSKAKLDEGSETAVEEDDEQGNT